MQRRGSDARPVDLAIIGGGPAGAAAALEARRRGLQVAVWERDSFPRHKVCGEFVSPESLPLLQQEIPSALARSAVIRRAEFVVQRGRRYIFTLPSAARGLSRLVLDEALWRAATSSGAEAYEGTLVRGLRRRSTDLRTSDDQGTSSETSCWLPPHLGNVTPEQQLWEVQLAAGGSRVARAALVACGRWWSLAGLASPTQDRLSVGPWLAAKAHFAGVPPGDAAEMHFFPGGYCGLAPIEDGLLSACCLVHRCLLRRAGAGLLQDFALWLKKVARHPALDARLHNATQVSQTIATAPLQPMLRRADESGALLAGDAAGFLDPFTGDGISQALLAGRLAAECVARACTDDPESLLLAADAYRRRLRQAVGSSYRVAGLLRLLVRAPAELQEFAAMFLPGIGARLVSKTRWQADLAFDAPSD